MILGGDVCPGGAIGVGRNGEGPVDLGYKPSETDHLNVKL